MEYRCRSSGYSPHSIYTVASHQSWCTATNGHSRVTPGQRWGLLRVGGELGHGALHRVGDAGSFEPADEFGAVDGCGHFGDEGVEVMSVDYSVGVAHKPGIDCRDRRPVGAMR